MMFIEIKEDKFEKIAEYTEKMLKYGGKIMSCLSEVGEEYGMSFREGGYGDRGMNYRDNREDSHYRSGYGSRYGGGNMGYRDDDEWEEMGERRGGRRRDSMGRYR